MQKLFIIVFACCSLILGAQNKKAPAREPAKEPENQPVSWESVGQVDTMEQYNLAMEEKRKALEPVLPRTFMVYTKKAKEKGERTKLCFHLVTKDTLLDHCVNDSLCKDPEVYKQLYESSQGDSTYLLIYVEAFTKAGPDFPQCDAGKESKLVFIRWNTKTNKVKFKQKVISSCLRGIVNMTKEPIVNWDGSGILEVSYYRGGSDFPNIKFDPNQPLLGMQESSEIEPK